MTQPAIYSLSCVCHGDGVRYVGQTVRPLEVRLSQHRKSALVGSTAIVYKWMRRHGPENIRIQLIEVIPGATTVQLNAAETAWIEHYRSTRSNLLNTWTHFVRDVDRWTVAAGD